MAETDKLRKILDRVKVTDNEIEKKILVEEFNGEIERSCMAFNPSELMDEFVGVIENTGFPQKRINNGQRFFRARVGRKEVKGAFDDCDMDFVLL